MYYFTISNLQDHSNRDQAQKMDMKRVRIHLVHPNQLQGNHPHFFCNTNHRFDFGAPNSNNHKRHLYNQRYNP